MAKSRGRGRLPLPRTREFFYVGSTKDEKKYQGHFGIFLKLYRNSKMLRVNEALNAARYILNLLDVDAETSLNVIGTGYDYEVQVSIGRTTLKIQQGRELSQTA